MDAETFRRKRERLGLTQEELGKRLDIARMTIYRYESGDRPIPKAVEMALQFIESQEKT
jgi:transcriptional regulator with XRE-family HTH domain